jgi:hypothetical protein
MAQASSTLTRFPHRQPVYPRNLCFDIAFQELALFREGTWRGGFIDGTAEISYCATSDDWWISDITIAVDNGQCGAAAEGKAVTLSGEDHPHLYAALLDRIEADFAHTIAERIADELLDAAA